MMMPAPRWFAAMLFAVSLGLIPVTGFCQEVSASASVDSNTILVGDWLRLRLTVIHPEEIALSPPAILDSIEGIEIVDRSAPSKNKTDKGVEESIVFTITSFDSGTHVIPPVRIDYSMPGDTARRSVETNPIPIFVRGIPVDTSQDIKDVKPPLSVPLAFADVLPYLIGAVILGVAAWAFFYIRKRRRTGESIIPSAPPRPPHELALESLRALEAEKLWQRGMVKEYHSQLTEIIRLYIERQFGAPALEMTTDELLGNERILVLPADLLNDLKTLLVRADFVKFAKFQPRPEEHEESLSLGYHFVESTRVMPLGTRVTNQVFQESGAAAQ